MSNCPVCKCNIDHANARFCPNCGVAMTASPVVSAIRIEAVCAPAQAALAFPKATRFILAKPLTQLFHDADFQRPLDYYTAPEQTYAVVAEQGRAYAIWCGGQQQAWVKATCCICEVQDISSDLTFPVPGFLQPAEIGSKRYYYRIRLVQMPLATISYASNDYRILYQWLGDPARYAPDLIGYVREVTQIASATRSTGVTEQGLLGFRSTSSSESVTVNHYRILVEDQHGTTHSVTLRQKVLYVPHRGDYVVLWIKTLGAEQVLVQGLRRDTKNPAVGSVFLPRPGELISSGFWAREILPS